MYIRPPDASRAIPQLARALTPLSGTEKTLNVREPLILTNFAN